VSKSSFLVRPNPIAAILHAQSASFASSFSVRTGRGPLLQTIGSFPLTLYDKVAFGIEYVSEALFKLMLFYFE
jgi:hypothetical protein